MNHIGEVVHLRGCATFQNRYKAQHIAENSNSSNNDFQGIDAIETLWLDEQQSGDNHHRECRHLEKEINSAVQSGNRETLASALCSALLNHVLDGYMTEFEGGKAKAEALFREWLDLVELEDQGNVSRTELVKELKREAMTTSSQNAIHGAISSNQGWNGGMFSV
jgi:hypothetical protein